MARHFGRLGRLNFNLHQGLYPLGSCTMKYNPAVNEALSRLDDFADLHPYHPPARAQGALRLMWELERALLALTAMDRMSLQPAAGAHGEWTGLRMIQAYHRSRGESRDEVLVPDSAHGTNPASATLSHLKTVTVRSGSDGQVDLDDFKTKISTRVAAVMLTNPNTVGLFEKDILEIARLCSSTTTGRTSMRWSAWRGRGTWASTSFTSTCTRPSPPRTAVVAPVPARSG